MQLLREYEAPCRADDRIFAHPRGRAAALAMGLFAAACLFAGLAWSRNFGLGWFLAGLIGAGLLVTRRFVLARFRPSNWLARMDDQGLWLKFRSYLNHRLPEEDPVVAFIPYSQIRQARRVRERRQTPDREGGEGTETRAQDLLELRLFVDPSALRAALAAERRRRPKAGALYGDHPV